MIFTQLKNHDPHKIALKDSQKTLSYGELETEITKRAQQLENISVLGLLLDNSVDWILWDLAALKSKTPCVPLPFFFSPEQITHTIKTAGISHIISAQGLKETGINTVKSLPEGTDKVTFTSGTTGTPKGVCLPKKAMEDVARSLVEILGKNFTGTHACVLPMAVLLENVAGIYTGLMAGCTLEITALADFGTNYQNLHDILLNSKATSAILVPEILRSLMAQIAQKGRLPHMQFVAVGGSKIDPALILQARCMGIPAYEGYGLSECASVVSLNHPGHDKIGSVGQLLPHVKAHITKGEIMINDPGLLGYISEPAQTPFSTQDLGELDDNGFLSITGRKKNIIITSFGRNISPEWVEASLLCHPEIAQVVVFGDAQPSLSALIVPFRPCKNLMDIINKANATLPKYAHIKKIHIVEPFTLTNGLLTGTGRPRRAQILAKYQHIENSEIE
jgi:long-chain acyl-CoA synthetase